jgi:hypothetical protein
LQQAAIPCAIGQFAPIALVHRGHAARAEPFIVHAAPASAGCTPSNRIRIVAANWDARFICFETTGKMGAQSVCCITSSASEVEKRPLRRHHFVTFSAQITRFRTQCTNNGATLAPHPSTRNRANSLTG